MQASVQQGAARVTCRLTPGREVVRHETVEAARRAAQQLRHIRTDPSRVAGGDNAAQAHEYLDRPVIHACVAHRDNGGFVRYRHVVDPATQRGTDPRHRFCVRQGFATRQAVDLPDMPVRALQDGCIDGGNVAYVNER